MVDLYPTPEGGVRTRAPNQLKKILVIAHPDREMTESMIATARELSSRSSIVTLFDVITPLAGRRRTFEHQRGAINMQRLIVDRRQAELEAMIPLGTRTAFRVWVTTGITHELVVTAVTRHRDDVVIVGPDPTERLLRVLQPLVATPLMRKLTVPLWIHNRHSSTSEKVAVVLGTHRDPGTAPRVDTRLLELSTSIARAMRTQLHVIQMCRDYHQDGIADPLKCGHPVRPVSAQGSDLAGQPHETHIGHGRLSSLVRRFIGLHRPRVVVVSSAKTSIEAALRGCAADRVIGGAGSSSVVTVNPAAYT